MDKDFHVRPFLLKGIISRYAYSLYVLFECNNVFCNTIYTYFDDILAVISCFVSVQTFIQKSELRDR